VDVALEEDDDDGVVPRQRGAARDITKTIARTDNMSWGRSVILGLAVPTGAASEGAKGKLELAAIYRHDLANNGKETIMRVPVETNIQYKQFAGIMNTADYMSSDRQSFSAFIKAINGDVDKEALEGFKKALKAEKKLREAAEKAVAQAATHAAQIEEMRSAMLAMEARFAEERAAKNTVVQQMNIAKDNAALAARTAEAAVQAAAAAAAAGVNAGTLGDDPDFAAFLCTF